MTVGGETSEYDYNGLDQLVKADIEDYQILYEYDARGNQVKETNTTTNDVTEHVFNVSGQMVSLIKKTGDNVTFTQTNIYDHEGTRIARDEGAVSREYYYCNGGVAYTEDNNVLFASNIQNVDGSTFVTVRGENDYNYLKNIQGSTSGIVDENGDTAAAYEYTDFGETEVLTGGTFDNEICYTGAIYDKSTGLYYLNARYYDPANARFISQDTYRGEIDDAGTWHLYAYCANNPINYVDPSGHKSKLCFYYGYSGGLGDFKKQAKKSPYYNNGDVDFIGVSTEVYFKKKWNEIDSSVTTVYMYLHGDKGVLCFKGTNMTYREIKALKKKTGIKKIYLFSCKGAKGTNSVAKAFYNRTGNKADVYAAYESISYRYNKRSGKYIPRYPSTFCAMYGWEFYYVNPVVKCDF